jgi:plasmid stabilization system protein ParE
VSHVELTAEAEHGLRRIAFHIAASDPPKAIEFTTKLREACEGLADFPKRFSLVPRYEHLGVRHRTVGNYLIFYRVEANGVTVIHILYGAMDYAEMLDPKP